MHETILEDLHAGLKIDVLGYMNTLNTNRLAIRCAGFQEFYFENVL
jgi:hypothetical protein